MAKAPPKAETPKAPPTSEKEVGHKEVTPEGKVKTYHGDGIFSIDN